MQRAQLWIVLVGIALSAIPFSEELSAAVTGWDFETGTLQGWTNVQESTTGPLRYYVTADPVGDAGGTVGGGDWRPHGYTDTSGYMAAVEAFFSRDQAQDETLLLRSPEFSLESGEQISAWLLGGDGAGEEGMDALKPTTVAALPTASSSTDSLAGGDGYLGIALRRVSDDTYVAERTRGRNSRTGWQEAVFSEADLQSIIASNPGEMFTLDLLDSAHGSWGALQMDSVAIPATATQSLVNGGGTWSVLERSANEENFTVRSREEAFQLLSFDSSDPNVSYDVTDDSFETINFHDLITHNGYYGNDELFIGGINHFVTQATGTIDVVSSGEITFGITANDSAILTINGQDVVVDDTLGAAVTTFGSTFLTAGKHSVELTYWQADAGATVELFVATTHGTFNSLNESVWELLTVSTPADPNDPLPGDYNDDGTVNIADYTVWRNALGSAVALPNEEASTTPGVVTAEDYAIWKQYFGTTRPVIAAVSTVPEPSSVALVLVGLVGCLAIYLKQAA